MIKVLTKGDSKVALVTGEGIIINSVQDALDIIANIGYEDVNKLAMLEENITPDFFKLSTGIAGEILQKFTNYRVSVAIVGEFEKYASKSLRDFIYECNKGNRTLFLKDIEEAIERLHNS